MPLPEPLLDRTKKLLRQCNEHISQREIAERSGVGLPWLKSFAQDIADDPRVKLVQRVHDFCWLYLEAQRNGRSSERAPAA